MQHIINHHLKIANYQLVVEQSYVDDIYPLVENIETLMNQPEEYYKKDLGDTTTVVKVTLHNKVYVIKRYNARNFLHGVKLQFRNSHGFRSFFYAQFLPQIGIPAIKPVAVIQKKKGLLKLESYFISVYEEGLPGCVYFHDDSSHKATWPQTIQEIANITALLQQNHIYHGDYHFGNFLIVNAKPILLDFDRIKQITNQRKFLRLHQKDLTNFNRYLIRNQIANNTFLAFL